MPPRGGRACRCPFCTAPREAPTALPAVAQYRFGTKAFWCVVDRGNPHPRFHLKAGPSEWRRIERPDAAAKVAAQLLKTPFPSSHALDASTRYLSLDGNPVLLRPLEPAGEVDTDAFASTDTLECFGFRKAVGESKRKKTQPAPPRLPSSEDEATASSSAAPAAGSKLVQDLIAQSGNHPKVIEILRENPRKWNPEIVLALLNEGLAVPLVSVDSWEKPERITVCSCTFQSPSGELVRGVRVNLIKMRYSYPHYVPPHLSV